MFERLHRHGSGPMGDQPLKTGSLKRRPFERKPDRQHRSADPHQDRSAPEPVSQITSEF
jgi:hypothetical protein